MGAGKLIMLVPLIDLKSLTEFSACGCTDFKSAALASPFPA